MRAINVDSCLEVPANRREEARERVRGIAVLKLRTQARSKSRCGGLDRWEGRMSNSCWERKMFHHLQGGVFCNDHFDYVGSRYRLFLFDCGRVAAERKERRLGRSFRWSGQPNSVWPTGRGFGSLPGDDLVRNHLHGHLNHPFDFCSATIRDNVRAFGSETDADEIAARDSGRAVRTADRSAKPGAHTEIDQASR